MASVRGTFRGINSDLYPQRLPSGTADQALNVVLDNGEISKRGGMAQYEDDVNAGGTTTSVLNIFVAHFAEGTTYVVCKCADGFLWQRKVYPATVATSFTKLSVSWTSAKHSTTDPGFFFMAFDRLHYFDSVGGSRWHPEVNKSAGAGTGVAFKAGIGKPALPTIGGAAAVGGMKDGFYKTFYAWRNSVTKEEGQVNGPSNFIETRLAAGKGALACPISLPPTTTYEIDSVAGYCSLGDTEHIGIGSTTAGTDVASNVAYLDSIPTAAAVIAARVEVDPPTTPKTYIYSMSFWNADHCLDRSMRFNNAGGEPPAAKIGAYNGSRAIYGQIYESAALVPGKMMYSIPSFPTSVPQVQSYTVAMNGVDITNSIYPRPYIGEIMSAGNLNEMSAGGGLLAGFTPTESYLYTQGNDGRLYSRVAHPSKGCVGHGAACGTTTGIHALGYRSWLYFTGNGITDLCNDRWRTTLTDVPVGQQTQARSAWYSFKNQVWMAVVKSGGTLAKRILVLDFNASQLGELTIFEPASLITAEGITAMCELSYEGAEPTMLIATNKGRILQYPSGIGDVALNGTTINHFAANWRGYFAQERMQYDQRIDDLIVNGGANSTSVTLGVRAMRTAGETITQVTKTLSKTLKAEKCVVELGKVDGNLFQIEFSTTAAVEATWNIKDIVLKVGRTDERR